MLIYKGRYIATDKEGYLKNFLLWDELVAEAIAKKEKVQLSKESWKVVWLFRNFYLEFNSFPNVRVLVKIIANSFGKNKGNSLYLYQLFPINPIHQGAKIAGLPKPPKCI